MIPFSFRLKSYTLYLNAPNVGQNMIVKLSS